MQFTTVRRENVMPTHSPSKNKYAGKSALIVEPTDIMRSALVKMLREMGMHPIHQAVRGTEAQRMLSQTTPDLIISEWSIEGVDGLELLRWCRAREETAETSFIFCTSVVEQNIVIQALKSGVSEFIAKPFSRATFEKHIDKAVKQPLNARFEESFPTKPNREEEQLSIAKFSKRLPENDSAPFTILVVDDNPTNIELASKIVSKYGRVKFATDGKAAIKLSTEFPPDLILLDIMMPEMNGYQVLDILKKNPLTESIPVIFLTARSSEEDIAKGLAFGAVDYVTKPINAKVLQARVANQKRTIEAQRALQGQVQSFIDNFALKADLERILFEHLRIPLNNLHDVSHRLMQKSITNSQAVKEGIILEKARTTIMRLIESLNSTVKLEDSKFQPTITPVSLSKVITQVTGNLQKELNDKSLSLDSFVGHDTYIQGDETLLYTMFSSLYLNAIEAAPRGSQVIIFHKQEEDMEVITFFNRGAVDKDIRERFFDKYISKGKAGGTGLGTYSAKLITESLGGSIELEADEEETRVHVKLKKASKHLNIY